jgi:hypothetical protein
LYLSTLYTEEEQVLRLLVHKSFFVPRQDGNQPIKVPEFAWTKIGKAFVKLYPEDSISLIDPMLEHLGDRNSVVFPDSSAISILTEISKRFPAETWSHVEKYLGPPTTSYSFWIERWLRGHDYFKDIGVLASNHIRSSLPGWLDFTTTRK